MDTAIWPERGLVRSGSCILIYLPVRDLQFESQLYVAKYNSYHETLKLFIVRKVVKT